MPVQREPVITILAVALRATVLLLLLFFVIMTMAGVMPTPVVFGLIAPDFWYGNKVEDNDHKKTGRSDGHHSHGEVVLKLGICKDSSGVQD